MAEPTQNTFEEIFTACRAEHCPSVNGSYRPEMLSGIIYEGRTPSGKYRIEIAWSDENAPDLVTRGLRAAFAEALRTASTELGTYQIDPFAVVGHIALVSTVGREEVEVMLTEQADLQLFEAA